MSGVDARNSSGPGSKAPDLLFSSSSSVERPALTFQKTRKKLAWDKSPTSTGPTSYNIPQARDGSYYEKPIQRHQQPPQQVSGELQKIMDHYGIDPNDPLSDPILSPSKSFSSSQDMPHEGMMMMKKRSVTSSRHSMNEDDYISSTSDQKYFSFANKSQANKSYQSASSTAPPKGHSEHNQRLASFGISISSAISNIVFVHPFQSLRRQCQVNSAARKYHLFPFSIVNVAVNLQSAQGFLCLWKGIGSRFWLMAITIGSESLINEFSKGSLPRDMPKDFSPSSLAPHLLLKTIVAIISSPVYSVHLVECVQSDMTSESPSVFSCISDAFHRVFHIGNMWSPRLLPFYKLLPPTVAYHLLRYITCSVLQQVISFTMRWLEKRYHERQAARLLTPLTGQQSSTDLPPPIIHPTPSLTQMHYPELISNFSAELITDIIFFPFETALHRIHVQGTRTIIDNTDTGRGFCSVGSRYEGFAECFTTIKETEGTVGLYRGFGTLFLQHGLKYAAIKLIQTTLEFLSV